MSHVFWYPRIPEDEIDPLELGGQVSVNFLIWELGI